MAVPNFKDARLDALNNLGEDGTSFDSNLVGAEVSMGNFIDRVQSNINEKGLVDSGAIMDITVERTDNTLQIMGVPYILFLDEGIKGAESSAKAPNSPYTMKKMPPSSVFKDWIQSKNIKVRNTSSMGLGSSRDDDGIDDSNIDSAAYAMAVNRYKYGSEPKDIFAKEIPLLIEEAGSEVGDLYINQMFNGLDELQKKINSKK